MIKVIHILNHLEKIDRDINEIDQMRNQLQLDRTYSAVVQESLNTEMARLTKLQKTIGTLIINDAPKHLITDIADHVRGNVSKPISQLLNSSKKNKQPALVEISVPELQVINTDTSPGLIADSKNNSNTIEKKVNQKQTSQSNKKKSGNSKQDNSSFQWKFVQK